MLQEDTIDLGKLLFILRQKKKIVISLITLCTVLAGVVATVLPKEYTSQVIIQVDYSDMGTGYVVAPSILSDIELLHSNEVLLPVIEQVFGGVSQENKPDAGSFAKKYLDIKNVKGTQLVKISAKGRNPQEAEYIAEHVATNFIELKNNFTEENESLVVTAFDKCIGEAAEEVNAAEIVRQKYIEEHKNYISDDLEYQKLSREIEAKKAAYENLVVQAGNAKIQQYGKFVQIVDPANLPDENKPSGPRKKLIIAIGFLIGCMISLGYGLLLYKRKF